MPMRPILRLLALLVLLAVATAQGATAGGAGPAGKSAVLVLPPPAASEHLLALPNRTLHFTATAGSVLLRGGDGAPEARIAYISYVLDGADARTRPVTFVFNGGPGEASAWLQLGAVGPWRIAMAQPDDLVHGIPSAAPDLLANDDTWLDFTDLVFIDPAGTGFSRIASSQAVRERLWSVRGDVASLGQAIRRWLTEEGRIASPKFLLGESYGGFRVPRLARQLSEDEGIGVRGLIMVSPVLDFARSSAFDPLYWAERLPSLVAITRAKRGPVTRAELADVESYAVGDFLRDALAGPRDAAARKRMAARVSELAGFDTSRVLREDGSIDLRAFLREITPGRIASIYDATITDPAAEPADPHFPEPDPIFRQTAPFTSAMLVLYGERLHWRPEAPYRLSNPEVTRHWNWGSGRSGLQSVTALREDLALDPQLHVLILHGLMDLITPYFRTVLILRHLPDIGPPDRLRLVTLEGGHMFYSRSASRAAFRARALQLIAGK